METLTKENFWNEMEQKYPKAFTYFWEFIKEYKRINQFDKLFHLGGYLPTNEEYPNMTKITTVPKYSELPVAMQFGIFAEFVHYYSTNIDKDRNGNFTDEIKELIEDMLVGI